MLENEKKKQSPTGSKAQFNQLAEPVNSVPRFLGFNAIPQEKWTKTPLGKEKKKKKGWPQGWAEKAHNDPGAPDYAWKYRNDKKISQGLRIINHWGERGIGK